MKKRTGFSQVYENLSGHKDKAQGFATLVPGL
jgi:hypothetical protein